MEYGCLQRVRETVSVSDNPIVNSHESTFCGCENSGPEFARAANIYFERRYKTEQNQVIRRSSRHHVAQQFIYAWNHYLCYGCQRHVAVVVINKTCHGFGLLGSGFIL